MSLCQYNTQVPPPVQKTVHRSSPPEACPLRPLAPLWRPEVVASVVVGVRHGGDVEAAGGERHLVWQSLHPALQVVEDVDIVVHHQSVVSQIAPPLGISALDYRVEHCSDPRSGPRSCCYYAISLTP